MSGYIAPDRCATADELRTFVSPWGIPVRCHKSVKRRLQLAMKRAHKFSDWKPKRIDSFVCRPIRGSSLISNHGRGAAWDLFSTGPGVPPPGGVWHPTDTFGAPFAFCFTDLGFTWGREWDRQDFPHLEWSGSYVPPIGRRERIRTWNLARDRYRKRREGK